MDAQDVKGRVFKNQSAILVARVVDRDGNALTQAKVSSVVYTIYELDDDWPDNWTAVTGHSAAAVSVASLIIDTLTTDDLWDDNTGNAIDSTGYNFKHEIDVGTNQAFTEAGKDYLVVFTITPTSGQPIPVRFRVECI